MKVGASHLLSEVNGMLTGYSPLGMQCDVGHDVLGLKLAYSTTEEGQQKTV